MQRRFAVGLTFTLGLLGGLSLAAGWYTATATEESSYVDSGGAIAGGVRIVGTTTGQPAPAPGHWIVSDSGVLTWALDSSSPRGTTPDAKWLADREKAMADIEREIECQIYTCDAP